jgi:hypothetical protein
VVSWRVSFAIAAPVVLALVGRRKQRKNKPNPLILGTCERPQLPNRQPSNVLGSRARHEFESTP